MKKRTIVTIVILAIIVPGLSTGVYFTTKIFNQSDWTYNVGEAIYVPNNAEVPRYEFIPDGHISVLPDGYGQWMTFWAAGFSYRTIGSTPYPENHTLLTPDTAVIGGLLDEESWKNGGSWLYSVHRMDGDHLIGFIHAEDHWYPRNPDGIAWKSIAVTQSFDNGISWTESQQIITAWKEKPEEPTWGGAGDFCVIRDENNSRWMCFYAEQGKYRGNIMHMAISTDPLAAPGTWKKWDGKDFTIEGLGGKGSPIKVISDHPGSNPSVSWNTYLQKWLMTWQGFNGRIYLSGSDDLIHWKQGRVLVSPSTDRIVWYPTLIGEGGDTEMGQHCYLYYGDFASDRSSRIFYRRTITFFL